MICNNCGQEIPNGGTFCGNCGYKNVIPAAPVQNATPTYTNPAPVYTQPATEVAATISQLPKKDKSKIITMIISVLLSIAVSAGTTFIMVPVVIDGQKDNISANTTVEANTTNDNINSVTDNNGSAVSRELTGGEQTKTGKNTCDFDIDIKSTRLTQNTEGEPVVVVTYILKNPTTYNEEANFDLDFDDCVYQNGVELEYNHRDLIEGDPYNDYYDLSNSDIKPGTNAEIQKDYLLIDTTSDIVVEVKEDWWTSAKLFVSRTFNFN